MGFLHRVGKKVFFGRFQKKWRWPEQVPLAGWERISVPRNGIRLAAVFGEARVDPVGAVVLAHPLGVAAKGFWLKHGHADLLRDRGFHVLAFDFNGFGESESADFGYPHDVLAAGEALRQRAGSLPLAIVGSSFGAGYALCAMEREGHPFRAAVLEGAFPTLPYFWRPYPIARAFLRASQVIYPRMERELRPIRAAGEIKRSPHVLLVHGTADAISPVKVGEELREAIRGRAPVELWTVEGAEHTLAFRARRDEYAERVTEFLTRSLAADGR